MTQSLRIAVADDAALMRRWYQTTLSNLGHRVVVASANGRQLVEQCRRERPDLLISDIELAEIDGLEATDQLLGESPIPIIIVSAHHAPRYVERALQNYVLAFLVKPIKQADLETAIMLVMRRFREIRALEEQAAGLTKILEDRKLVERAKGILMQRTGLDEPSAFKRLQKLSQDRNQKLSKVAQTIIHADEVFSAE